MPATAPTGPRFTPRGTELAPIVAMLESADFDTSASLARAIVQSCYASLLERDWYVTLMQTHAGAVWGYGLSATPAAARKMALHGPARVVNITSARKKLQEIDAL
jgi:hypothetical protein